MSLKESTVEEASIEWFEALGNEQGCPKIASECVFRFPSSQMDVLVCTFQSINNQLSPRFIAT
jgi:hypothetical protein